MAIQIKETPILEGKDAISFLENLHSILDKKTNLSEESQEKKREFERMRANYEQLQSIVTSE